MPVNVESDIQDALLELLKTFSGVCELYGLRYYAWGGTALGAIRHKGFIPWDDDIDIAMPREDFDRLCGVDCDQVGLPDGFSAFLSDELLFGVFQDEKVPITHGSEAWDERQPYLSLDIFPLDGTPRLDIARKLHHTLCQLLFVLIKLKRIRYIQSVEGMKSREATRPMHEQLLIRYGGVFEAILGIVSEKALVEAYFKEIKAFPFRTSSVVGYFSSRYRGKSFFPSCLVDKGRLVQFEDFAIPVFSGCEEYLARVFGPNYMAIPPKAMREHHGNIQIRR